MLSKIVPESYFLDDEKIVPKVKMSKGVEFTPKLCNTNNGNMHSEQYNNHEVWCNQDIPRCKSSKKSVTNTYGPQSMWYKVMKR
jgi:hypothetical protein